MASQRKDGGARGLGDALAWHLHSQPSVHQALRYWLCLLLFIQQVLIEHFCVPGSCGLSEMHRGVDYNPSFRALTGLKGDRTDADQSAVICKLVVTVPGTLTPASVAG